MPSLLQGFYTKTYYKKIYHLGRVDLIHDGQNGRGFHFAPLENKQLVHYYDFCNSVENK